MKNHLSLTVGQRIKIVTMTGCMGDVRGIVRQGMIESIKNKPIYDGNVDKNGNNINSYLMAIIRLDGGTYMNLPADINQWTENEGLMEYRQ